MSLPKKTKRLNKDQSTFKEKPDKLLTSNRDIHSNEYTEKSPADSARNKQMIKAFEIVEHIEHVHGTSGRDEHKQTTSSLISPVNNQASVNTKKLQVKVAYSSKPGKEIRTQNGTGEEDIPVIEVKLKIPSFFRKVPILKGITDNLIRRFAKE
jgi:hypothetical protein